MAGLLVGLALAAAASAASADEGPPDAAYRARGLAAYAKQDRVRLTHQRDKGSNMGDDAAEVARMREALAWFQRAVDADPTNAENHAYVGNAHFRLDEFGGAKAAYERAVALDPAAARYRSNLGSLFAQRGRYAEALHYFQAAKALDPSDGTLAKNYDSAEMFLRFEQMVEELEGRGDGAHWDVAGFVDGRNYSEKVEVTFTFVMEQRADLHERALGLLRPAVAARPDFAALSHVLGNTLVARHQALHPVRVRRGDPAPLLDEARTVVGASLARGAALGAGACPADAAEATGTLRVVSVSSSRRLELDRLAASARRVGATLEVLGLGEPWRGLGSKVDLLRAYLADPDRNIRDGDLLLFLDAYDVLLLPPARDLPAKFAALEIDEPGAVVFNSELACAPDGALRLAYPRLAPGEPFHFLNSGVYLGRVRDVRAMLDAVAADVAAHHVAFGADPFRFDDQRWRVSASPPFSRARAASRGASPGSTASTSRTRGACTSTRRRPSSRRSMPPADATASALSLLRLRVRSAPTAFTCSRPLPARMREISGEIAPASAITTL
jgi:tetratricopeptide (TPR) repeat protein